MRLTRLLPGVAESSHASYFGPDRIPASHSYDHADGLGGTLYLPDVEQIRSASPAWVEWPGRWGDPESSPPGPRFQPGEKWRNPSNWALAASEC